MALTLPGLIIISVLFLGLLFIFTPLLYGPYLRVLEDREALEAGIARDGNESPELEAMEQQIQQALSEARDAARSATAEARAKTVASANREVDALRQRLASEAETHREQLRMQTETARQSLHEDANAMAAEIGDRVLGRTLS
ncbi:MAG TPA: hypothetical protein DEB46_02705 [Myxococcales bacterium]|nr:hypothetical protein [Myxococcales bacterium]